GVIGIGIGSREEGGMEFVVLVDKDAPMPDLPSNLGGMPVVAEKISKIVIHNGGNSCDLCHAEKLPMPVPMGTSTSTNQGLTGKICFSGTTGFKACDNASGKIGYVTNNHIGAAVGILLCENGPPGLVELHPGARDADPVCTLSGTMPIGILSRVVTINFPGPNLVDAAFVESSDQETSNIIRDIGPPTTTPGTPTLGMCVKKSGRSTGLTFGRINLVNMTVPVSYICGGVAIILETFRAAPDDSCGLCENPPCSSMSLTGDSGAAVLDLNNNIVGLLFAGNDTISVAVTIQNVLSELNVSLDLLNCGGPPPPGGDGFEPGDANADGFVNLADLGPIINAFRGTPAPGNGDCNGDGFTNLADLGCDITLFRGPPSGPTPTPSPSSCPPGQKECTGGCILIGSGCCGTGTQCPAPNPVCCPPAGSVCAPNASVCPGM
ncbi:hypothetical protein MYX76_10230, partial [Desulfobacterota bacterium AH_259_B03_O07]|nr:hypothetical protein [Desulfobacterota bacterium AH_259_B03_O07]